MRGVAPLRGLKISYRVIRLGHLNLVRIRTFFFRTHLVRTNILPINQARSSLGALPFDANANRTEVAAAGNCFKTNHLFIEWYRTKQTVCQFFPDRFSETEKVRSMEEGTKNNFLLVFLFQPVVCLRTFLNRPALK